MPLSITLDTLVIQRVLVVDVIRTIDFISVCMCDVNYLRCEIFAPNFLGEVCHNSKIYYTDTGVLLENTPLKIHAKLHPGPEGRIFNILTGEDIVVVISRFFTAVCDWVVVCLYNNKNITR